MKARGGRAGEAGGRMRPGGGNGETDGRRESAEWGEEVGRGGVPAGDTSPHPSLLPANVESASGGGPERWPESY